jgi:hypothetical protein
MKEKPEEKPVSSLGTDYQLIEAKQEPAQFFI